MRLTLLSMVGLVLVGACTGATEGQASSDVTESRCEARLRFWQKDAYRATAGRDFAFWPVHTTTQLELVCDGALVDSRSMSNHGTDVGDLDANGEVILVEARDPVVASGSRSELRALAERYAACTCDPTTTFLSLDALDESIAQDLLASLADYLRANLECSGGVEALVAKLESGAVEAALAAIPSCGWKDGKTLVEGLDGAIAALADASQRKLADYHVCNNDAELQAELFERFRSEGVVVPCAPSSALCHGPAWFYEP